MPSLGASPRCSACLSVSAHLFSPRILLLSGEGGGQGEGVGEWADAEEAAGQGFVLHEGEGCGGGRRLSFAVEL